MTSISRTARVLLPILLFFVGAGPVAARDLSRLAAVLAPVFVAENFATLREVREPGFLAQTAGSLGTMHAYSLHMKNEVVARLGAAETEAVLKAGAGAARDLARKTLRDMNDASSEVTGRRLDAWCALSAKSYVRRIIREHDFRHDSFTRAIEMAAQD